MKFFMMRRDEIFLCFFGFFFIERRRKLDEKNLIWWEVWELLVRATASTSAPWGVQNSRKWLVFGMIHGSRIRGSYHGAKFGRLRLPGDLSSFYGRVCALFCWSVEAHFPSYFGRFGGPSSRKNVMQDLPPKTWKQKVCILYCNELKSKTLLYPPEVIRRISKMICIFNLLFLWSTWLGASLQVDPWEGNLPHPSLHDTFPTCGLRISCGMTQNEFQVPKCLRFFCVSFFPPRLNHGFTI